MNITHFTRAGVLFLAIVIMTPSVFFSVPQKAHAWTDIPAGIQRAFQIVQETLIEVHEYTSMISDIASTLNTLIFQPLAFVLSGNLMKMLTSSVVGFVIGKANGTGMPQFIVDVQKSMQTVADAQALAYLKQVNLTNSPFSSSITAALRNNYLQGSSLSGFWKANLCSLSRSTPNVNAYLAGNWSQGGVATWFALTTQTQNNPYTLYNITRAQMGNVIGPGVQGVTGARTQTLAWGQGFMSWCGSSDTSTQVQAGALTSMDACIANGNTPSYCDKVFADAGGAVGGINPGDPCTNTDGTSGTIKTPGSVISDTLSKVLGGQQDEIIRMGNIGPQITSILGDIANIVNTVKFASNLLGGNNGPGGLFGVGQASAANPVAPLNRFTPPQDANGNFTGGYAGVSSGQILTDAANSPVISATSNDVTTRVKIYQTAWVSINTAATAAETSVTSLQNTCQTAIVTANGLLPSANYSYKMLLNSFITDSTAQVTAAKTALTSTIQPVLVRATTASTIAAAALAMNERVNNEVGTNAYQADLKTLMSMPPAIEEVTQSYKDAQVTDPNEATSTPPGTLTVAPYPSIVDQMHLIETNAKALLPACTVPADPGNAA